MYIWNVAVLDFFLSFLFFRLGVLGSDGIQHRFSSRLVATLNQGSKIIGWSGNIQTKGLDGVRTILFYNIYLCMLLGFCGFILCCLFSFSSIFFIIRFCKKLVFLHSFRFYCISNYDAKSLLVLDARARYTLHDFVHVALIFSIGCK